MVKAVRGAIQIDANEGELIRLGVVRLITDLVERNNIDASDLVSIQFSQTRDLTSLNPATALRSLGYGEVPLFCTQEPEYEGEMPRMIRVLVTFLGDRSKPAVPVYLNGAERLRSDLFSDDGPI